jgi:hypothetical protein
VANGGGFKDFFGNAAPGGGAPGGGASGGDFFGSGASSAPSGGMPPAPERGPAQIQSIHGTSPTIVFPGTDAPPNFAVDQQMSGTVEDMRGQLRNLQTAVDASMARHDNSSKLDRVITAMTGDPQKAEQIHNWGKYAELHYGHMATDRDAVFENASGVMNKIYTLLAQQGKTRNFKFLEKADDHIPSVRDTDQLLKEKTAYWVDRLNMAEAELRERGIPVRGLQGYTPSLSAAPSTAPPTSPSGGGPAAAAPVGSGLSRPYALPKPDFVVKKRTGSTPEDSAWMDDKGKWHIIDKGRWVVMGE